MKKRRDLFKFFSVAVSLIIIYSLLFISILEKDKNISYIENKILSKFPEISATSIATGQFMRKFDTYITDQFPKREEWISLKRRVEYAIGKREFRDIYITNTGRLLKKFILDEDTLYRNIKNINTLCKNINIKSSMLLIPTSTEIYKDELSPYSLNDDQEDVFKEIKNRIEIKFYSALDILKKNRDKYIFFNTDHHWTQLGAKITFEDIFGKTIDNEMKLITDEFYGSHYSKVLLKSIEADKIYACQDFAKYEIDIDYQRTLNSLYDETKLHTKNKYQYFLSGDPGRALIKGNGSGRILILKDSFAHNFVPFLADEFSEIHIIDPRYYKVDIKSYIEHFKIEELLIIHNIETLNSKLIY